MPIPLGIFATAGAGGAAAALGSFDHLETFNITGTNSTYTISGIDTSYGTTYKHLQLRLSVLCNNTIGPDNLSMKMNGDTTTNILNNSIGQGASFGRQSPNGIGSIYCLGYDAANFASYIIDIPDAFETSKFKVFKISHFMIAQVRNFRTVTNSQMSAAISSLTFKPFTDGYGSGLIDGSKISLYGIKG